jgi:hypothetical protein
MNLRHATPQKGEDLRYLNITDTEGSCNTDRNIDTSLPLHYFVTTANWRNCHQLTTLSCTQNPSALHLYTRDMYSY